ncbi:MAG: histidine--tRNA ligase [Saprospiraceae bacterium]|nr:histidine--tRNA ligase [Saprospiraceae bacterium]
MDNIKKIIKPRNTSGFADYTEAQNYLLSEWIRIVEQNYSLFGFTKLIPRPLELREVLLAKGGIQKQIFGISRLPNDNSTDLALPFDRTVPLANWVAKHQSEIDFPYKRYDIGYSFRGERSQNGRFQGFYQADIDIIGRGEISISADAECIAVIYETINKLGIGNAYLNINNLKLINLILKSYYIKDEYLKEVLNIVDEIPKVDFAETKKRFQQLSFINQATADSLFKIFTYAGSIEDFIKETECVISDSIVECINEVKNVFDLIQKLGVPKDLIIFKTCIVRGLDYYTGTVFETFIKNFEHFGSVASGGRYDDLASTFTKEKLPGFGGSIGLTRLFDLVCKNKLVRLYRKTETDILICSRELKFMDITFSIASLLRKAEIKTDVYTGESNITKQLKYANKKGIRKVLLVMESDMFILKDMLTGQQNEFKNESYLNNHLKFNLK